jgi:hypothetical protein
MAGGGVWVKAKAINCVGDSGSPWRGGTRTGKPGLWCDVYCGSWRDGLERSEQADENQPPLTVRTDPRLDQWPWLSAGRYERWSGGIVVAGQVDRHRRLALPHLSYPSGIMALRWMHGPK